MGVQVAEDESATVEEDDEWVRPSAFFGGVVPRGDWPVGPVDDQIPHSTNGGRPANVQAYPAPVRLACLGRGEGLQRGSAPALEQRESELYFGLQGLAVDAHRRAA